MTEAQEIAKQDNARQAVCINLLQLGATLRPLLETIEADYKENLLSLFESLDEVAQRIHKGVALEAAFHSDYTPLHETDSGNEVAQLKAEIKELKDRNSDLTLQNLDLATGKELVITLGKIEERMQGIELSLIKLTDNAKL